MILEPGIDKVYFYAKDSDVEPNHFNHSKT